MEKPPGTGRPSADPLDGRPVASVWRLKGFSLLLVLVIVRMGLLAIVDAHPEGGVIIDSRSYLALADRILEGGFLSGYEPEDAHRTLGYPAFLALVRWATGSTILVPSAVQLGLAGGASILLCLVGAQLGDARAGLAAGYLYAMSPSSTLWSLTIMSETLFAVLALGSLWGWISSARHRSRAAGFGAGACLALGALVRPIGLPLILLWVLVELARRPTPPQPGLQRSRAVLFAGGAALVLVVWIGRNWVVYGEPIFARTAWNTLIRFNLAYVVAEAEGIDREEAVSRLEASVHSTADVWEVVKRYPVPFAQQQVRGILRTLFGVETGVWARQLGYGLQQQGGFGLTSALGRGGLSEALLVLQKSLGEPGSLLLLGLTIAGVLHVLVLYASAAGLIVAGERMEGVTASVLVLSVVTIVYMLLAPGAAGQARFRIPVEPLLALTGGFGLRRWSSFLDRARSARRSKNLSRVPAALG